jgi:exopolyphosphatase/pppGpp-phosphohydrolase
VEGIGLQRAEIIVPGTAVLLHFLEALRLPGVVYSPGCVRDGIIADLSSEI